MQITPPNCSSVAFPQCSQTERAPVYVFQSQSRTVRRRVRVAELDVADMERWRGEGDGMLSQPSGEFRFLRPQRWMRQGLCGAVVVREHTAVEGRKVAWERFRLWIHFTDRFCGGND